MTGPAAGVDLASLCRHVVRAADRATLSTTAQKGKGGVGGPWAYASLTLAVCDTDLSPILLVSNLADHTRNLRAEPRVSLLFDGTAGLEAPMTGPRVSLQGVAEFVAGADGDRLKARYLGRHPSAARYAGFGDFHMVRVRPVRAHLVAGFGRAVWIEGRDFLPDAAAAAALAESQEAILGHMNADHAAAVDHCANRLLGLDGAGWTLAGIDPDGIDLRREARLARLDFSTPIAGPDEARAALVDLVRRAREA